MIPKTIPRVTAVGAREDDSRGHMCGKCRNPFTREGNPECPNAPRPPVFPDSPYDVGDMDDPAQAEAWFESERLDADIDIAREEKRLGSR
ncbi:hypothetical protein MUN77_01400 [Leucobacter allii]|uniref:hypothetical protein n=1 Tax=Leucobacter allii TaxID=2932247 RepID=UPI001FD181DE|nr:hypothetical protein [Leucobacter allii]UOR02016.1 hypothetical protein MUN77_01400 [Leucobacter allii]